MERAAADHTVVLWRITGQGRLIGSAWLSNIEWLHRQASSGMVIGDRAAWGQGYGSEVVSLRTAFAFQELGLERLETFSLDTNVGMHRALERSGFRRIGVRSRHFLVAGGWHDAYIFELNRADWLRR